MFGSVVACWLAADCLSGIWHWIEDRYFEESWPWIGRYIAKPNALHHRQPAAFLHQGYWSRNWTTILPAASVMVAAWSLEAPWQVLLTLLFVSQANEIHAWSHRRVHWPLVLVLQDMGALQSPRHHAIHHKSPHNVRYCVMSDWVNPLLDATRFWFRAEWCLARIGVHVRADCRQAEREAAGSVDRGPTG